MPRRALPAARLLVCLLALGAPQAVAQAATGPLTISTQNPRYFADPTGRIVYLTPVRKETDNVVASLNVTTNDAGTEEVDETGSHTPINELREPDLRMYSIMLVSA